MALNLFTQKYINNIDVDNIPEEFITYFNEDLDDSGKHRIYESRPDVAEQLGYNPNEDSESIDMVEESIDDYGSDEISEDINAVGPEEEPQTVDLSLISVNIYDGINLAEMPHKDLNPLEMLSIREGQERCKIHRCTFDKLQFFYTYPSQKSEGVMATYSINPCYCKECNRLYISDEWGESIFKKLSPLGKTVNIYSLEESDAYIRSQLSEIELQENECIYIPDVWIEEKLECPVHNEKLEQYPYIIRSGNKSVKFDGYFCVKCNKPILRKAKALELEDRCAEIGVSMPKIELLIPKISKKNLSPKKDLKPHYYIESGRCIDFSFENSSDFYKLDESDTIVISDSIYCDLLEHDTDEVMIVFPVNQKTGGRRNYLCLAGYCQQCQKYYMAEDDYKVIYPIGRPEVTIISNLEDSEYQITSGEVFDLEKKYLDNLEESIKEETDAIYNADDYVNPYKTYRGGYDEGSLQGSKELSKHKYEAILSELNSYKPKPYSYRVDLSCDGDNLVFYLGAQDITLSGRKKVISYNDRAFGAKIVNSRTIDIDYKGKKYKVKLSRQFDIQNAQLFGYVNLRTDEDIIFRAGITDPFLIKVLNLRKKQHSLVDIIATIQENQNTIVDEKFSQNIIVQGCAGSGKTMVLLHRLSSLKYNTPEFDFSNALILTPNEDFNLHIKGLADGLQIGFINRLSIEQYYLNTLRFYSDSFIPQYKISSEVFVNQAFVDYIYSEEYLIAFINAYDVVIEARKKAFSIVKSLCDVVGHPYTDSSTSADDDFIPANERIISRCELIYDNRKKELSDAEDYLKTLLSRKSEVEERILKAKASSETIIDEIIPRVYTKIGSYMSSIQRSIEEHTLNMANITNEAMRVENQVIIFGKKQRLNELKKQYDSENNKLSLDQTRLDDASKIITFDCKEKAEEEIIAWIKQSILVVEDIQEELRLYNRMKNQLPNLISELETINGQVDEATTNIENAQRRQFPLEAERALQYLHLMLVQYTDYQTFNQMFDLAVSEFKEEYKIKTIKGTHRYDLYAQLLFCMKYYAKVPDNYRFICIDEGQDMALNEYKLINYLNNRNIILNIYGDTNQLLKPGRGISDWTTLETEFKMKRFILNENYRNTNQITRFCNMNFEMNVMQTGVDGAKVREIPRKELELELSKLKLGSERVAILVSRSVRRKNYLDEAIIPNEINSVIGQKMENGHIAFMYVDEVKGIEFDKVFVVSNHMSRNEKYIAFTRALSELIIVVDDNINYSSPVEEME